jgi:hypothetical protein
VKKAAVSQAVRAEAARRVQPKLNAIPVNGRLSKAPGLEKKSDLRNPD